MKKAGLVIGLVALPLLVACNPAKSQPENIPVSSEIEVQIDEPVPVEELDTIGSGADGASVEPESEKPFVEGDQWVELDRSSLSDDTYDPAQDSAAVASLFVHSEVGKAHDGVKYYLEYIDNDNLYVTFDNSANTSGRCVELFVFDNTLPNKDGEDWSIARAKYYIEAGETVVKQYHIGGQMKEEKPLRFGIAIDDRGFNYEQDRASTYEKSGTFNLDITYYGIDNTVFYYDVNAKAVEEKLPEGFNNIK